MDPSELLEPFARLLDAVATPAAIRVAEAGGGIAAIWEPLEQSGFLDAMVPEAHDGAGLDLATTFALIAAVGAHALPLPVAETIAARALLALAGHPAPAGPIAFATAPGAGQVVPAGLVATHILFDTGKTLVLVASSALDPQPTGVPGSLAARIAPGALASGQRLPRPPAGCVCSRRYCARG